MHFACSRCLLTEDVPGVKVDAEGICSVCREHDRSWSDWDTVKEARRATLDAILDKVRSRRHDYDVLVPLSGGKDSTYVLYVCRKQLGLNCLAVTWDNGFLTEHALENINNAVDVLGADHVYYGVNKRLMMRLYGLFFLKTGFFCPVCMRGIQVAIERAASAFKIGLVISGTSLRTEEYIASEFFQGGSLLFFREVLKGEPLENDASPLMYGDGWPRRIERLVTSYTEIDLPDFLDWNYDEIYETITREVGWKAHRADAEHSDCKLDDIVNYIRYQKFPALVPEMLRFSKLVTAGQMTREEAQRRTAENRAAIRQPDNLDWFLDSVGVSREEMDEVLTDPFRHMKYIKGPGRSRRAQRTARRLLLDPIFGLRTEPS